jgi:hypothetical protein
MNSSGVSSPKFSAYLRTFRLQRGLAFGVIIITALLAFELFNYITTDHALTDLLGGLTFMGVRWATILSIAFCGIDFAGIARLFTPEGGSSEGHEVWYLFGAWLLAATMNAMLTWWGVSLAVLSHDTLGSAVIGRETLLRVVPIFVAVLVWLIRVLIIGTFSVAGDRLFSQPSIRVATAGARQTFSVPAVTPGPAPARSLGPARTAAPRPVAAASRTPFQPAPKPQASASDSSYSRQDAYPTPSRQEAPSRQETPARPDPTYHPVSASPLNPSRTGAEPRRLSGGQQPGQTRSLNGSPRRR